MPSIFTEQILSTISHGLRLKHGIGVLMFSRYGITSNDGNRESGRVCGQRQLSSQAGRVSRYVVGMENE